MITKRQLKALGFKSSKEIPNQLWNQNIKVLYEKCDRANVELDDDGQTYQEFIQMAARHPNEQGTGRFRFSEISSLDLIVIAKAKSNRLSSKTIKNMLEILNVFTKIKTNFNKSSFQLSSGGIVDKKDHTEFQMQYSDKMMEVQPLLSFLIEFKKPNRNTIALIEHEICEDSDHLQGRACGDGVAAIAFKPNLVERSGGLQSICWTVLHETLHTLGFDHCLAWKCIMNGIDDGQIWPCPACLRKLMTEVDIGVFQWIQSMTNIYEKQGLKKGASKGRKILEGIKTN